MYSIPKVTILQSKINCSYLSWSTGFGLATELVFLSSTVSRSVANLILRNAFHSLITRCRTPEEMRQACVLK
jgi:hypothetical protein